MVVFYDLDTKEIVRGECNTMMPILPMNMNLEEKTEYFKSINEGFVTCVEEFGSEIFDYNLVFDTSSNFIGLQTKEAI